MAKPKKPKPPFALRALATFAVTLAALFVLLLAAYALPGEPVRDHVYDSAVKIAGEGLYPEYLNFKLFQMDNYTDTIMLTEAASADEAPPLTAMMTNTAYNVDNFETLADDLQWYIERDWAAGAQRTDAPALVPFSYARYWHGYLIWLRPLLLVTDITGVRVVQYLVAGGGCLPRWRCCCAAAAGCGPRCGSRSVSCWSRRSGHRIRYSFSPALPLPTRAASGCWPSPAAAMMSAWHCWFLAL